MFLARFGVVVAAFALLALGSPVWAAPTAEQRAEILALGTQMTKAGNLYKAGKFKEAADVVKDGATGRKVREIAVRLITPARPWPRPVAADAR